jgi:hypothetical protein
VRQWSEALAMWSYGKYRLLFGVTTIVSIGYWFHATMLAWIVLSLTGSAAQVGLLGLFSWGPYAMLGLLTISIPDRFSKRTILLWVSVAFTLTELVLAVLALCDQLKTEIIFGSCLWRSLLMCLEQPARQGLLAVIASRADLQKVLGVNAVITGLARVVAPTLASGTIALVGAKYCFVITTLLGAMNVAGLYFLTSGLTLPARTTFNPVAMALEGLRVVAGNLDVFILFAVLFCVITIPLSFEVIVPVFTQEVLSSGVGSFGTLMSCWGIGSVFGSLYLSATRVTKYTVLSCAIAIGLVELLLAFQASFLASAVLLALAGACGACLLVGINSIILSEMEAGVQGRVGGLYSYVVNAIGPTGSAVMGWMISFRSVQFGLIIGATIAVGSALCGVAVLSRQKPTKFQA